jgi:hypothetical protein
MNEIGKVQQPKETKFRDVNELTSDQMNDPDFRLKQLNKLSQGKVAFICGKCGPDAGRSSF